MVLCIKTTGIWNRAINFRLNASCIIIHLFVVSAFPCSQEQDPYILSGANIIDLDTGTLQTNMSILISDGEIKSIYPKQSVKDKHEILTIDLDGKFVIPGLIDGHVHTTAGPSQILVDNLQKTLKSGVTTVRDMGGDGILIKTWKEELKDQVPNILSTSIFAGKDWIMGDRRSLSSSHGKKPGTTPWLRYFRSETVKEDLESAKEFGVNGIKIYADLNKSQIEKIVNEAEFIGLPVYAHSTVYPASPLEVVEAGVKIISHVERMLSINDSILPTTYFYANRVEKDYHLEGLNSDKMKEYLGLIKKDNVAVDATLLVSKIRSEQRNDSSQILQTVFSLTKMLYEMDTPIIAGTDYMISPEAELANLHQELHLLVEEVGFSNLDALRSATIIPADFFGLRNKGKIHKGLDADMVILNSNPLEDIGNTSEIHMVIKSGVIID